MRPEHRCNAAPADQLLEMVASDLAACLEVAGCWRPAVRHVTARRGGRASGNLIACGTGLVLPGADTGILHGL
jgi:hypothetical protein